MTRWVKFILFALLLLAFGMIKENYFIYLTIRMYGFEFNPISHFKESFYQLFTHIPSGLLKPLKWASFGSFALFYYFYQLKVLDYFFPSKELQKPVRWFYIGGAVILGVLLPLSRVSLVILGIYQGIVEIYLSPWPMIMCFLYAETMRSASFAGKHKHIIE